MSTKTLDLSKKADFLTATGSAAANLALLFGKEPAEWDIMEADYNGVSFHVFQTRQSYGGSLGSIRDTGGRRIAKFKFPYKDGQTTDDLGREAENFDVDCVIFGDNYNNGLVNLMKELQKPKPGWLLHPIRGHIQCKMQSFELLHAHDFRKAVQLKITFCEHNFDVGVYGYETLVVLNIKSILGNLLYLFALLNDLRNKINGLINLYNSIIAILNDTIAAYEAAFQSTIVDLNQIFNKGNSFDIPSIVPVNQGGVLLPDGTLSTTNFPSATNPNDPFVNIPVQKIQADIAAKQKIFTTATEATVANILATLAAITAQNKINSCRTLADILIKMLESVKFNSPEFAPEGTDSDGSLEFYNEILDLKRGLNLLQQAYEQGSAQSKIGIKRYITPRLMTVREVAFANQVNVERSIEIDILNYELESLNYIAQGTEILVPL